MIGEALKAKAAPYLLPVIGTLVVVAAGAFWWLWNDRDRLLTENSNLSQAMDQAEMTNTKNLEQIDQLQADIRWLNDRSVIRAKREQDLSNQLAETVAELEELVKNAPCSGPEYLWPNGVFDIMRKHTVSDPDRVRPASGTGRVSD